MHEGHRQRMLLRFREDPSALADHEILEILLYGCLPRVNTNPIAHELIASFGSLKGVFSATYEQLCAVKGVGEQTAAHLACLGTILSRMASPPQSRREPEDVGNLYEFRKLIEDRFANLRQEIIALYCLDAEGRILFKKEFLSHSSAKAELPVAEINGLLAERKPCGIVLAHNHPYGSCRPSGDDDRFTREVHLICSMNDVYFYDHVIFGTDGAFSYFADGDMEKMREECRIGNVLRRKI